MTLFVAGDLTIDVDYLSTTSFSVLIASGNISVPVIGPALQFALYAGGTSVSLAWQRFKARSQRRTSRRSGL